LDDAAGGAFLSEWALKLLAFLTTSTLLVAGSIPAGVANFQHICACVAVHSDKVF
jgi:hypothetical protein